MRSGLAWLSFGDAVWLARGPWAPERADTPLLRLLRGVWRVAPGHALRLLRRPIVVDRPLHRLEVEAVRVVAKRARVGGPPPQGRVCVDVSAAGALMTRRSGLGAPPVAVGGGALALAARAGELAVRAGPLWRQDRTVGAVLVLPDGRVGAWARNGGGRSRAAHAEIELVRRWTRAHGPLPRGATFAVSLQPCRMCAAAIVAAASDPLAVAVRYLEPDPGPHAARTWLDEIGTLARGAVEAADEPHGA